MRVFSLVIVGFMCLGFLTGCETVKSTVSGPFIGMEKDLNNLSKASQAANNKLKASIQDPNNPQATNDQGLIKNLDTWVQKNWW